MTTLLSHLALALALFVLMNAVGRRAVGFGYLSLSAFAMVDEAPAFNFLFRVLGPAVYLVVFASAAYILGWDALVERSYLVVVYYVAFRLLFNIAMGRALLLNWWNQTFVAATTIVLAYALHQLVIQYRTRLLPDAQTIAAEVWLVVILFVYQVANSVRVSSAATGRRKAQFIVRRLRSLHDRYGDLISGHINNDDLQRVAYALLIVETFNRPAAARLVEYMAFPLGLSKTLGAMQVTTSRYITDRESVELGLTKLAADFETAKVELTRRYDEHGMGVIPYTDTRDWQILREAVARYNPDGTYADDVMKIAGMITEHWSELRFPAKASQTIEPEPRSI